MPYVHDYGLYICRLCASIGPFDHTSGQGDTHRVCPNCKTSRDVEEIAEYALEMRNAAIKSLSRVDSVVGLIRRYVYVVRDAEGVDFFSDLTDDDRDLILDLIEEDPGSKEGD